ncbi:SLC13 family permease [Magnetococcus sp. PR-3]|uniref:SLC13 family permease n=1 Tax=Magnetococcus sp. PR-3 TaxID=3120355 RepID=UPI002FCE025C
MPISKLVFALGALLALLIVTLQPFETTLLNGALAIVLFAISGWASGAIPEHLTALIFFLLAILSGIAAPAMVFSGFLTSAFWLVFAGIIIGAAMKHTGLDTRLAHKLAHHAPAQYGGLIAAIVIFGMVLAFLMPSSMGRAVLIVPLMQRLAQQMGYAVGSRGYIGILLAGAMGSFFPGFGILPANVPNMVMVGAAESLYSWSPSYGGYLLLHFPLLGLGKSLLITGLITYFYHDKPTLPVMASQTERVPYTTSELRLALLLTLAIVLWVTDFAHGISPAWVGLGVAVFCLLPGARLVEGRTISQFNLSPLLYVAGIIGMGAVVAETGLGHLMAEKVLAFLPLSEDAPVVNWTNLSLGSVFMSLLTTQPGLPAVMSPLAQPLAEASGLELHTLLMIQVLGYSTTILPYQAPPLVVAAQLGRIPFKDLIKMTFLLALLTLLLLVPLDILWWMLLGAL